MDLMMNTFDKCKLGTFGWVIFSYGVFINVSQNRKARTACITPVDKLVYSWYTLGLVFLCQCLLLLLGLFHAENIKLI